MSCQPPDLIINKKVWFAFISDAFQRGYNLILKNFAMDMPMSLKKGFPFFIPATIY
jgi:hypothetical protein